MLSINKTKKLSFDGLASTTGTGSHDRGQSIKIVKEVKKK